MTVDRLRQMVDRRPQGKAAQDLHQPQPAADPAPAAAGSDRQGGRAGQARPDDRHDRRGQLRIPGRQAVDQSRWACRPRRCASTATPEASQPRASSATSAWCAIDELVAMGYAREQCARLPAEPGHPELHDGEPAPQPRPLQFDPGRRRRALRRMVHQGRRRRRWLARTPLHLHHGRGHEIVHDEEANRVKFAVFSRRPDQPHHRRRHRSPTTPWTSSASKPT